MELLSFVLSLSFFPLDRLVPFITLRERTGSNDFELSNKVEFAFSTRMRKETGEKSKITSDNGCDDVLKYKNEFERVVCYRNITAEIGQNGFAHELFLLFLSANITFYVRQPFVYFELAEPFTPFLSLTLHPNACVHELILRWR